MDSSFIISEDSVMSAQGIEVTYEVHDYRSASLKEALVRKVKGLGHSSTFSALRGVDLELRRGECLGLIGHNGSGKSTMLKVLAGILPPTKGSLFKKGVCMPLIELGAGFDPELTGRENIFLCLGIFGFTKKEIVGLVPSIHKFSELGSHLDMPVKTYSSGMYMRLGFACSVCVQTETLLIDEILAVGDSNFQRKCLGRMKSIRDQGTTMVLVSHDMNQIQSMADRVAVFDQGLKVFDGHPRLAVKFYEDLMHQKELALLPEVERTERERQTTLKQNHVPEAFGDEAKLIKGELKPIGSSASLCSGSPCHLEIEFKVLTPLADNPCIGFALHTSTGMRISGGNTHVTGSGLEHSNFRLPGTYMVRFDIERMPLAPGIYRLIIAAHNQTLTRTLDINGCAQEFEVHDPSGGQNFDNDLVSFSSFVSSASLH